MFHAIYGIDPTVEQFPLSINLRARGAGITSNDLFIDYVSKK